MEDNFPYKAKVSTKQKKIGNKTLDDLVAKEEVMIGVVDRVKPGKI